MPEGGISSSELEAVVREVVATLDGDLGVGDIKLFVELEQLAAFIETARREIAALQPEGIINHDIPGATDELDAIVAATESATGDILDAVETIEQVAGRLDGEAGQAIGDAVTRVYEACNFQDITGQRITKVVRTFQQIERKLGDLTRRFAQGGETIAQAASEAPGRSEVELLNGPSRPGEGVSQEDIDKLLASFD